MPMATTMTGSRTRLFSPPPKTFQFQIQPDCFSTMVDRFIEPASRITVMMIRPIDTSYDTI